MISDEGGYAYVAHFWSGDSQLYRDIRYDRPQAIFLIYKLCLFIFGGSVEAIRLAAALYNALTVDLPPRTRPPSKLDPGPFEVHCTG